jgi:hypothetical protein
MASTNKQDKLLYITLNLLSCLIVIASGNIFSTSWAIKPQYLLFFCESTTSFLKKVYPLRELILSIGLIIFCKSYLYEISESVVTSCVVYISPVTIKAFS